MKSAAFTEAKQIILVYLLCAVCACLVHGREKGARSRQQQQQGHWAGGREGGEGWVGVEKSDTSAVHDKYISLYPLSSSQRQ